MRVLVVSCFVIFVVFQIVVADDENDEVATYEEIKDLPNHPEKYLIDVRNRMLVERAGSIPGGVNIPYYELKEALMLSDKDFASTHCAVKPPKDAVVIFFYLDGKYAQKSTDLAKELGWTKAKPYLATPMEWAEREG